MTSKGQRSNYGTLRNHIIPMFVKGGEKVCHCGGGIVYHRHEETASIGSRAGLGQEQGSAGPK